tara:strand:+ start:8530 stop:8904 length:375 start_codon:yes stop_codon:yes gene_type:complete
MGEIPSYKVYEDDEVFAFLDAKPINPGHTLVIPKEHHKDLYEIPDETLKKLSVAVKKVAMSIKKGINPDGINIGMNNETAAGQVVFHAHIHVIPRLKSDNLEHWPGQELSKEESEEVLTKIKIS